jgi:hypothetical protein
MDEDRKEALKEYCHLDDLSEADELLLEFFYNGAVSYMEDAGIPEPVGGPARAKYDLVVNAMVNDAWDNRRSTVTGQLFQNPAWARMKNQLKFGSWGTAEEVSV